MLDLNDMERIMRLLACAIALLSGPVLGGEPAKGEVEWVYVGCAAYPVTKTAEAGETILAAARKAKDVEESSAAPDPQEASDDQK